MEGDRECWEEECVGKRIESVGKRIQSVKRGPSVRNKIGSGGKGTSGKRIECAGKRRATLTQFLLAAIYNPA